MQIPLTVCVALPKSRNPWPQIYAIMNCDGYSKVSFDMDKPEGSTICLLENSCSCFLHFPRTKIGHNAVVVNSACGSPTVFEAMCTVTIPMLYKNQLVAKHVECGVQILGISNKHKEDCFIDKISR